MSNVQCVNCKQHKKQENFTALALSSETPICNGCDLKMLQSRLAGFDRKIISLKKEQQVVKDATKFVERSVSSAPPKKQTSLGFLKTILANAQ